MKTLLLLCLIGCAPDTGSLSITPNTKYQPDPDAATLTYTMSGISSDPYINKTDIISVNTLFGEFGIIIKNDTNDTLHNLEIVVVVNDITKIDNILPGRIYNEFFWGNSIFGLSTPTQLPNNKPICNDVLDGNYTLIDADNLEPGESVVFGSVVIGDVGLKIHLQAYGENNGNYIVSCGNETTIQWSE